MKKPDELEAMEFEAMLFPVKVYDGKGNLKRIIKVKSLSTRHWKKFEDKTASVNYDMPEEPVPVEMKNAERHNGRH